MTAKVPADPIGEEASTDLSETILAVPFLIPTKRMLHISSGRMNSFTKIV